MQNPNEVADSLGEWFEVYNASGLDLDLTGPDPIGVSMGLEPGTLDAGGNDEPTSWCLSTTSFGDGDLGTPGEPNDPCR